MSKGLKHSRNQNIVRDSSNAQPTLLCGHKSTCTVITLKRYRCIKVWRDQKCPVPAELYLFFSYSVPTAVLAPYFSNIPSGFLENVRSILTLPASARARECLGARLIQSAWLFDSVPTERINPTKAAPPLIPIKIRSFCWYELRDDVFFNVGRAQTIEDIRLRLGRFVFIYIIKNINQIASIRKRILTFIIFFQGLATKVYEATQYGESSSVRALARERSVAHSFHFIPIILFGIHLFMATVTIIQKTLF